MARHGGCAEYQSGGTCQELLPFMSIASCSGGSSFRADHIGANARQAETSSAQSNGMAGLQKLSKDTRLA